MNGDVPNPALLPGGLIDLLPPDAEVEAEAVSAVMAVFAAHGYQRVKPPLLEFEDGLLTGSGAAMTDQTFRLMDPESRRMMGLRADITPQVARIASTRLAHAPRPLRLSYAGQSLRVHGTQLAPDRQVAQAGIELIGVDNPAADAEMVLLAAEALAAVGLVRVSFDLTIPPLAPALLDEAGIADPARARLTRALDRKDTAAVAQHAGPIAGLLTDLLLAAGPANAALQVLQSADLGPASRALCDRLAAMVDAIHTQSPGLRLTLDPLEFRGFRYHTGICVTVFAPGHHEELGRGGRYVSGEQEPATGLTLFPDPILRARPQPPERPRAFLPWGTPHEAGAQLRAQGCATVSALHPTPDPAAEARRLACTHLLEHGTLHPLTTTPSPSGRGLG
jgi:ATP phosphoribosyltransferase regulatory subunit